MDSFQRNIVAFFSQPWGVVGALCIMVGATAFNSRRLKGRLSKMTTSPTAITNLLNAFNLVGGACLLVNAWVRDEIVWIVLEIYFVAIAVKGLWQTKQSAEQLHPTAPASSGASH